MIRTNLHRLFRSWPVDRRPITKSPQFSPEQACGEQGYLSARVAAMQSRASEVIDARAAVSRNTIRTA